MTKRFIVPKMYRCIQDNLTKEHYLCEDKTEAINLAYLLNKLHEENQELKQEMGNLGSTHAEEINKIEDKFDKEILKLEKENEQLKSENKKLNERIGILEGSLIDKGFDIND